jgi:hypothetical protein
LIVRLIKVHVLVIVEARARPIVPVPGKKFIPSSCG